MKVRVHPLPTLRKSDFAVSLDVIRVHTEFIIALRLYPVIPGSSRIPTEDTVLPVGGGSNRKSPIFVAAGTLIVYHVYVLHRREDLWGPDAAKFRPER